MAAGLSVHDRRNGALRPLSSSARSTRTPDHYMIQCGGAHSSLRCVFMRVNKQPPVLIYTTYSVSTTPRFPMSADIWPVPESNLGRNVGWREQAKERLYTTMISGNPLKSTQKNE